MNVPVDIRRKLRALKKEKKALISARFEALQAEEIAAIQESVMLEKKAFKTELTNLDNRESVERIYKDLIATRHSGIFEFRQNKDEELGFIALSYIDIDHFKSINDTYGHDVGDEALRHVASVLKSTARAGDIPFHISGDEMGVLYSSVNNLEAAMSAAERVRKKIEEKPFVTDDGVQIKLTSSFGVAVIDAEKDRVFGDAVKKADKAMYASKQAGRNCVTGLTIDNRLIESNGKLSVDPELHQRPKFLYRPPKEEVKTQPEKLIPGQIHEQFRKTKKEIAERKRFNAKRRRALQFDDLTDLHKRSSAEEMYKRLQSNMVRQGSKGHIGTLMLDINSFKQVNDTHGHTVGDKVLQHFASIIKKQIRPMDIGARWGGEEFVVVLKSSSASAAVRLAKRIECALDASPYTDGDLSIPYKVSIGVSTHRPLKQIKMLDEAVKPADRAMYKAKQKAKAEDNGTRIARERKSGRTVYYNNMSREVIDVQALSVRNKIYRYARASQSLSL